jgi:hypothetical protein
MVGALLAKAKNDPRLLGVFAFGSFARGEDTPSSDVDICLVLSAPSPGTPALDPTRVRLEYLKEFPLDVQVFQGLPLYIRRRILREGRLLFVRDEDRLYDLAISTAKAFEDFKHIYFDYLREVEVGRS